MHLKLNLAFTTISQLAISLPGKLAPMDKTFLPKGNDSDSDARDAAQSVPALWYNGRRRPALPTSSMKGQFRARAAKHLLRQPELVGQLPHTTVLALTSGGSVNSNGQAALGDLDKLTHDIAMLKVFGGNDPSWFAGSFTSFGAGYTDQEFLLDCKTGVRGNAFRHQYAVDALSPEGIVGANESEEQQQEGRDTRKEIANEIAGLRDQRDAAHTAGDWETKAEITAQIAALENDKSSTTQSNMQIITQWFIPAGVTFNATAKMTCGETELGCLLHAMKEFMKDSNFGGLKSMGGGNVALSVTVSQFDDAIDAWVPMGTMQENDSRIEADDPLRAAIERYENDLPNQIERVLTLHKHAQSLTRQSKKAKAKPTKVASA